MKNKVLITVLLACCLSVNAYESYYVPQANPVFRFNVYAPWEDIVEGDDEHRSSFLIPPEYVEPLLLSAQNWNEKFEPSPILPAIYAYISINEYNAGATSPAVTIAESPYKCTLINARLHNWTITTPQEDLDEFPGYGLIEVGLGYNDAFPGWQTYSGGHSLYHGELPDLYSVMNHEIMHSLGLSSMVNTYQNAEGDSYNFFSESNTDPLTIFDSQLRIYKGGLNPVIDPANEIASSRGPAENATPAEIAECAVGEGMGFDVVTYSPYFVGENVIKVLGGSDNYDTARQKIVDNGGLINYSDYYFDNLQAYPIVYGLPIHPSDGEDDSDDMTFDLSHIELRNSYMSHQDFRNWLIPMEAELALLKDIGYDIDLRKYFGKSYYLNNQADIYTTGFSEWNGTTYTGNPSTIDQAVGIHIYGNNNNITQAVNDINLSGEGSFGVRIDGVNNAYTLAPNTNIIANGKENIGIAATWGSGHTVNVQNGASVIASGKDGIAASFDYGSNLFGTAASNIKGSYINTVRLGYFFIDTPPNEENRGPLVTNFNVNGTLQGDKAAIFISDNAYVQNININDGALINGNIISEWNSISSLDKASVLKFDGTNWVGINRDNPDEFYYTNLNFNAPDGVTINGDIMGDSVVYNTLKMNNAALSVINFNGEEINVNSLDNEGQINLSKETGIAVTEGEITGNGEINVLAGAGLRLPSNISNVENRISFNNAKLNTIDNFVNDTNFSSLVLNGQNSMSVDVDLAALISDKMVFNNSNDLTVNAGASLSIDNVNLMNTNAARSYTNQKYYIPFISSDYNNQNLLGNISFNASRNVFTPIFKYNLGYEETPTIGSFTLSRGPLKSYGSYNPAVAVSPVAAQFGGYLSQLNSYEQAFHNLDMKMLMTREERQALRMANSYASAETPKVFSPIYLPENDKAGWFRPYATFEKVGLKNGPRVENISYGSYFGGDSPMYQTKNGWDYQYSVYAGYNGSHQNYSGNSIYQNGGTLGATCIWYKGDFFTALTANVGAGVAEGGTMYGSEDFPMLMSGIASKTGYNWELAHGKFIIQPSYLMSYSFVNTFDYTNAAGVRIKSDPLNAINIAPGLKFIGNLKNGWQPYAGIQMVWNIMDKTDFRANNIALPDMSIKPYVQYGVGLQKRWGDRFTGFFQTMIRNGGRNGIALSAGFRWAIGK